MPGAFADIAFTPAVLALQRADGSRPAPAAGGSPVADRLGEREAAFIAAQRSFYLATVSETGWPYVQHRGGPPGFLKVLDEQTLAFADFAGNRQFVSVGNAGGNDRVALILVDYARRVRLKVMGHMSVQALAADDPLLATLVEPGYRARPQRSLRIRVAAFDWNCPQHIPLRFDAEDVRAALAARDEQIEALKARLARFEAVADWKAQA